MKVLLENISKHFGTTKAVDDVTLEIKDGKLTGLLGPSGCGKSTTLYLISGLEKPTSGKIFFDDEDVTDLEPEERGIGLVFQNYALYPHMTVLQNIMFPLENIKVPKAEAKERALQMARLTRVDGLINRKPAQLSGGQQQRVAIARALVKQPKVLLLDEPLSNLDARLRIEMRSEIRRIQQETGVTTIFVTHDQEEAMNITDEIVLMKDGKFIQQCSPQEMYLKPDVLFSATFLGNPPINVIPAEYKDGALCFEGQRPWPIDLPETGDQRVTVGIRAESFTDGDEFAVEIDEVEVHGRDQLITFSLNGTPVRALVDTIRRIKTGDKLNLAVKYGILYVFDPESGKRLNEVCAYE